MTAIVKLDILWNFKVIPDKLEVVVDIVHTN
jgi:hypothetical protein